jgi:glyoxylase-like metal-dependent hydrolase (beta-lactamase superfamily II)
VITIKFFVFSAFQENTYVLSDESKECVIIDPGCFYKEEYSQLFDYITNRELKPVKIVNTHMHIDHIFGLDKVSKQYALIPEFHKEDLYLIHGASDYAKIFGFNNINVPSKYDFIDENSEITFGNSSLKALHVPGHSLGSIAFYNFKDKFVITGDVLFKGSIGRTDLPGGNYDVLMESINNKLLSLNDDVAIYPGHGPSSTIGIEKRTNPYLKK